MNVLFVFTQYTPDKETLERLWELQQFLSNARWGLSKRVEKLHPYWQSVEKQKHHNYLKSKIKLVGMENVSQSS